MRSFTVAERIDLNVAASGSAIQTIDQLVPFNPGAGVVVAFSVEGPVGTALRLEGREDAVSSYSTLAEIVAADGPGTFFKAATLTQEIRYTVVGTAGAGITGQIYLLGN